MVAGSTRVRIARRRVRRRARGALAGRRSVGVLEAALKGALAGVAGGLAMIGARELEQRGIAEGLMGKERRKPAPRRAAKRVAREVGVELSPAESEGAGVLLQLATAAAVGAVYGVARTRLPLPHGADGAVLGGIVYFANAWGVMPSTGLLALPPEQSLEEALVPVGTHAVYGLATARVFSMLGGE